MKKVLGHSSLDVVKEYVSMFSNYLQKDFDKFNSLEQMVEHKQSIRMHK